MDDATTRTIRAIPNDVRDQALVAATEAADRVLRAAGITLDWFGVCQFLDGALAEGLERLERGLDARSQPVH